MATVITTQHGRDAHVVDLARGDPGSEFLPTALVRDAAARATAGLDPDLLQYGHEPGDLGFRSALAAWLAREGAGESQPERLFVTAGASLALHLICALFTRPGERVLVADPTYHLALAQFSDHGLRVEAVSADPDGIDPDALDGALREAPAALLYLVPAFANPTGATLPPARQEAVVAVAARHGLRVVADEVYRLTGFAAAGEREAAPPTAPSGATGPAVPRSLAALSDEHVLSLNSVSKILSPGLRLGWIEGSADDLRRIANSGVLRSGGGMNPFTAALVREAIAGGALSAHLAHVRALLRERHQALASALQTHLPQARFAPADGGYFLWLHVPGLDVGAARTGEALREHGVRVARGALFSAPDPADGDTGSQPNREQRERMRVCFAHAAPAELREGARRLAAALHDLQR